MPLQRITLHLARSKDYPNGSASHGYELIGPLDETGHLDVSGWKRAREACIVRRFWGKDADDLGHLVHRAGGVGGAFWAFTYDIAGDEDEEAGYRLGDHSFNIGDYVSIRDDDGKMHTFVVALLEPA